MPLLELWKTSPPQIEDKQIHQLLAFAGNGKLTDGSDTSKELRAFPSEVPSKLLAKYVDGCLGAKFDQSGLVLQDLVNEVGRRLGFGVEHGRYRGSPGQPGNDGLWKSGTACILVEVKTTDAYRISLDTLAGYRSELIAQGKVAPESASILLVVGRQDTGDLEEQVRGSRHAWSIRLVSVDALLRLLSIKESVDDPAISAKIVGILRPQEFTRVDGIVDLVFRTAEDIQAVPVEPQGASGKKPEGPAAFNDACAQRLAAKLGKSLTKASRSLYTTTDSKTAVMCLVSKLHEAAGRYWFAVHPRQKDQLESHSEAFIVLGCGSAKTTLAIPWSDFREWLPGMFTTELEGSRMYWHVSVDAESFQLFRRKGEPKVTLKKYLL